MGESIIIESPELQTRRQRMLFAALTCVLWTVWTYLWLPVITLVEWLLDLPTNYQAFVLVGYAALREVLLVYCSVIVTMGGSLIAWATYNLIRFRGTSRRRVRPAVDLDSLATFHAVQPAALADWQQARHLVLDHDENGSIATVTLLSMWQKNPPRRAAQPDEPSSADVTYVISGARPRGPSTFRTQAPAGSGV